MKYSNNQYNLFILMDNLGIGGQQLFYLCIARYLKKKGWNLSFAYAEKQLSYGKLESQWVSLGKCLRLKGGGSLHFVHDWSCNIYNIAFLYNYLKKKQPDVILCGSSWSRTLASILGKLAGVPVVNIPGSTWYLSKFYRNMSRFCGSVHACAGYHAISEKSRETYIKLGIEPRRIIASHHGTDLRKFRPKPELRKSMRKVLGFSDSDLILGYGGRISPEKGLKTIIHIFHKLKKADLPWKLLIVGDGPQKVELLNLIDALELNDKVTITGFVDNPNEYYTAIDCAVQYCSAPHGGMVNLGTFTVEAMATGSPVLHFVPSYICDGYEEGVSGFFVDYAGNPSVLYKRLLGLDKQPEALKEMGRAARRYAVKHYDFNDTLKKLEEAFILLANGFWPDGSRRCKRTSKVL